jgi:catechol 2,3-dioxygenase-like lactoylglutathione lyase family enzyme
VINQQTPPPSVQISTVEIPVADLARAIEWYRTVLGLNCTWSDEHHAMLAGSTDAGVQTKSTLTSILLVRTNDALRLGFRNTSNGLHHSVIDFQTADLEAFHAHLLLHGTQLDDLTPPANEWAPRGFGFFDCEGNRMGAFTYSR